MDDDDLPAWLTTSALLLGNEYAWRMEDVRPTIEAACNIGLACAGGCVLFVLPDTVCEAYELSFDPSMPKPDEAWNDYALRARDETIAAFDKLCRETDFRRLAAGFRAVVTRSGSDDPLRFLWFVLYFG